MLGSDESHEQIEARAILKDALALKNILSLEVGDWSLEQGRGADLGA
jgi:hypothetical protein